MKVDILNSNTHSVPFNELRNLQNTCGPQTNKHDRAIVCIHFCIDKGFRTRKELISILGEVGCKRGHVAILLKKETGDDPSRYLWKVDKEGRYSNHPLETK